MAVEMVEMGQLLHIRMVVQGQFMAVLDQVVLVVLNILTKWVVLVLLEKLF